MKSIKEFYKIGNGPSSSHTMGPKKACEIVEQQYHADKYLVKLYGSLSMTGKGHLTDKIIRRTLRNVDVLFSTDVIDEHPNTLDFVIYKDNVEIATERFYSVGGGIVRRKGEIVEAKADIYPHRYFEDIKAYCLKNNIRLYEYVYKYEADDFKEYLGTIWQTMEESVKIGLDVEGNLPGLLKVERKAKKIYHKINYTVNRQTNKALLASAYAYAVSETNASGGRIVTAPTCGASGVLPGVLFYLKEKYEFTNDEVINALATAGLIGNLIKHNASISGAEAGCQAEIGTACSMAAAANSEIMGNDIDELECAAEIALEHHLGLTCDPVLGYVQIPCIERNGVAAMRALNASELSLLIGENRKISFDGVVETMLQTGKDLGVNYRETSEGGLAAYYKNYEIQRKFLEKQSKYRN